MTTGPLRCRGSNIAAEIIGNQYRFSGYGPLEGTATRVRERAGPAPEGVRALLTCSPLSGPPAPGRREKLAGDRARAVSHRTGRAGHADRRPRHGIDVGTHPERLANALAFELGGELRAVQ